MYVQPQAQSQPPYYIAEQLQQPPPLAQPVAQQLQQPPLLAQPLTPAAAWMQTAPSQGAPLQTAPLQTMPLPYPAANTHTPVATGSHQPVAQTLITLGQPPSQSQTHGQPPSQGQQPLQNHQPDPARPMYTSMSPGSEPDSMTIFIRKTGTLVNLELNVTLMNTIDNVKEKIQEAEDPLRLPKRQMCLTFRGTG